MLRDARKPADLAGTDDEEQQRCNTDDHHNALDKVRPRLHDIAAEDEDEDRHNGDDNQADGVGNAQQNVRDGGDAFIDRSRIRHQKDKNDQRRKDTYGAAVIALFQELRHGFDFKPLRGLAGAAREHHPGEPCAEDTVADTGKDTPHAVLKARAAGVADEHDSREIGRAVGKRGKPRAGVAPADGEVRNALFAFAGDDAYGRDDDYVDADGYPYP